MWRELAVPIVEGSPVMPNCPWMRVIWDIPVKWTFTVSSDMLITKWAVFRTVSVYILLSTRLLTVELTTAILSEALRAQNQNQGQIHSVEVFLMSASPKPCGESSSEF